MQSSSYSEKSDRMPDPTESTNFLTENWKWIVTVIGAVFIKPVFDYLKARITGTAEAAQITKTSETSTLQVSDSMLRQWMQTASDATARIGRLENCLWELLPIVEQVDTPGAKRAVERVRTILDAGHVLPKPESKE